MATHTIGTEAEHLEARLALLKAEKELTRLNDELAERRRALPWVRIDRDYRFDTEAGEATLIDLFHGRSQLIVYHFMYGPDWDEGCPSCSFWADSFDGIGVHLAHRDVTLVCVSRARYEKLAAYRARMGWRFPWYSSADSAFNFDFGVSFTLDQQQNGGTYNFTHVEHPPEEAPGISAFALDDAGGVFHTYSTFSRGLDPLNSAYQLLDLTAHGRDEDHLEWPMAWLRRHDTYDH